MKKYIVYLTINTVNNKIYVGVHKLKENSSGFDGYLGLGININDRHSYSHPKFPFQFAVQKYGINAFKRCTICECDSEEEALKIEAIIVNEEFVKRKDTYNVALGGGMPPFIGKEIFQYEKTGEFIKKWISITEACDYYKVTNTSIGRAVLDRTVSVNYLWTDFYLEKLNIDNFVFATNKKLIHQYDSNGIYLKSFDSIAEAAKETEALSSSISMSLIGGYKSGNYYYSEELKPRFDVARKVDMSKKCVHKYKLSGEYVESFDSIKSGADSVGITPSRITTSIRTGQTAGNYQWSFDKHESLKPLISTKSVAKRVAQCKLDGEIVKIFDTVSECKKYFTGCTHVLKGTRKTAGGYFFKYVE